MGLAQTQTVYTGQEKLGGTEVCCQVTLGLRGDGECQGGKMGLKRGEESVTVKVVTQLTPGNCCQDRFFTGMVFITCWALAACCSPLDTVLSNIFTPRSVFVSFYLTKDYGQEDPDNHLTVLPA